MFGVGVNEKNVVGRFDVLDFGVEEVVGLDINIVSNRLVVVGNVESEVIWIKFVGKIFYGD